MTEYRQPINDERSLMQTRAALIAYFFQISIYFSWLYMHTMCPM